MLCICAMIGCSKQKEEVVVKETMEKIEIQVNSEDFPENDVTIEMGVQKDEESKVEDNSQIGDEDSKNDSSTTLKGKSSILDFLKIAIQPVGSTMYIWGGGWNEEDTAAGIEAVSLGVSLRWAEFASVQKSSYNYNTTRYQIHDGLDCSGYVGWAVYNVLESENGKAGYVMSATKMAKNFSNQGLGTYIPVSDLKEWKAGDIMSMNGHVWIVVGMCEDGSVLFLHSSPPGVMFSGTKLANGSKSQAVLLAEQIMKEHYPNWYARYPEVAREHNYLTTSSAMRWGRNVLSDDENICNMSAEEIVALLF